MQASCYGEQIKDRCQAVALFSPCSVRVSVIRPIADRDTIDSAAVMCRHLLDGLDLGLPPLDVGLPGAGTGGIRGCKEHGSLHPHSRVAALKRTRRAGLKLSFPPVERVQVVHEGAARSHREMAGSAS